MTISLHSEPLPATTSAKEALYAITSDGDRLEIERARLNLLHKTITTLFDRKLIFAPVVLSDGDHVLDCGTGTGVWPNDVVKIVPQGVRVEAADISPRFFPLPGQISPVTFHPISTIDFPAGWENRFQLINQRLMLGSFSRSQWETVIQQIYRVAQPGGWVQLVEIQQKYDFSATHPKYQRGLNLVITMMKRREFICDTGAEVEGLVKRGGFKNITRVQRAIPLGAWGGEAGRESWIWIQGAYRGMREATIQAGCVPSGEEFDRLMTEAFDEVNEIPGLMHDIEVICGQKV